MKLIQLNIWSGRLVSPLAEFFRHEKPDILCAQEAIELPGGDDILFLSNEEVQRDTDIENIFFSPVFSFNFMQRKAGFGNGIYSKYPLVKTETIFTFEQYYENFDYIEKDSNMRNFQHAIVKTPGGKLLHVLNHHGYRIDHHKNGDNETLRQCTVIAEYIEGLEGAVILTGDFNLTPESKSIKKINEVLVNLSLKARLKTTRTMLTHKTEVCDYIFVSKEVQYLNFFASDEIVSDHKALMLEFDL